jgi:hypothetical protein
VSLFRSPKKSVFSGVINLRGIGRRVLQSNCKKSISSCRAVNSKHVTQFFDVVEIAADPETPDPGRQPLDFSILGP